MKSFFQMPMTLSEFSAVRKIRMAVTSSNGIVALELYDARDNVLISKFWGPSSISSKQLKKLWVTQSIKDTEKIIGFKVSTAGDYIQRFGWQLV